MTEQILDIRSSLRLLRRFWQIVAVVTLAGLIGGVAYGMTRPPAYKAKALVLLPGSTSSASASGSQIANTISTDASIATSAAVLVPAGQKVDRSLSLSALQHMVTTSTSSDATVLGIVAGGPSSTEAVALANAVADQLVSFVTSTGSDTSSGTVAALQKNADNLTQQVASIQAEIATVNARLAGENPGSTNGQRDTGLIAEYTSEQADLQLQLNGVKNEITQTQLGQISANQGTQVIQRATGASSSRTSELVIAIAIGVLVGAIVGSVLVLVRHRSDPKLFTRDQLARAVGVPVVLSLATQTKKSSGEWAEMLERYEPSSSEQWNVRRALREVGALDSEAPQLEILVMDRDAGAAALAAQLAIAAAISRLQTVFVLIDKQTSLPALQAACLRLARRDAPRPYLQVLAGEEYLPDRAPELTVTTRVLDPTTPLSIPHQPGTVTVLAVSSGIATEDQLARMAIAAADSGQPLRAVLVANPSPDDQTTGSFPGEPSRAALVVHRRTLGAALPRNRMGSGRLSLAVGVQLAGRPHDERRS